MALQRIATKPTLIGWFYILKPLNLRFIMEELIKNINFGSIITAAYIRDIAGIVIPERGTFKEFQQAQLNELQFISAVRDNLLNKGMYLKREGEQYRVLLPSENAEQCKRMNASADRKYTRAILLEKLTPKEVNQEQKYNSSVNAKIRDITARATRQQLLE